MDQRRLLHLDRSSGRNPIKLIDLKAEQLIRLSALSAFLDSCPPSAIAVSGGLDSRLLSTLAASAKGHFTAFHLSGPHITQFEESHAQEFLASLPYSHSTISIDPLSISQVAQNHKDRCYHCKHALFSLARQKVSNNFQLIIDGTNASDLGTYRPGLKALQELHVFSPFAHYGITKQDIKDIAKTTGLSDPAQPARPCLFTRFPYNAPISHEQLQHVALLEDQLLAAGWTNFRVRILSGSPVLHHVSPLNLSLNNPTPLTPILVPSLSGYWDK